MGFALSRKVLMGSIAVTLALGAGTTAAFAATSKGSTASHLSLSKQSNYRHGTMMGTQMMSDLASDLKLSTSTLQADFKSGKTISEIASAQKIPTSTLISELESTLASQQTSHMSAQVTDFVNGTMPKFHGHGPGKAGGWHQGPGFSGAGNMMSALASDLKLSSSALQADVKAGKTISEIASAQGVQTSTLISELESTMKSQLSKAVASGKLTSAQETKMLANIDKQVTDFVNGTMPKFHGHGPGRADGWHQGPEFGGAGNMMSTLASDLKLSSSALQADVKAGKTISEIASAQGVQTSTLISELESQLKSQMTSSIDTEVTKLVNSTTVPQFGMEHGWHGRPNSSNTQTSGF